ncbi:MAG: leishmanolysin-related zinc metalloendopeptidase [Trueperaceae bacterium]|nr:leishmanolysin-related zinc metalloendopeptidase [Trueperaceae bacterium]
MRDATEYRRLAATLRWSGLFAAAIFVVGLTACSSPFEGFTPDTQAPTLYLSGVSDGDVITTSEVTLTAVATDDRGVASVRYSVNGSTTTACDAFGGDTWSCASIPLTIGANTIEVTVRDDAGNATSRSLTVYYQPPTDASGFNIEVVYFDQSYSASQLEAFQLAADRWESIVVGDLEGFPLNQPEGGSCNVGEPAYDDTVDDLLIFVTSFTDEAGGLLGEAGPCLSRTNGDDAGTNAVGYMRFDTEDLDVLEADGNLVETIVHEMGHVLGIGTNWEWSYHDLLDYQASGSSPDCANAGGFVTPPSYTGTSGRDAWLDLGGWGRLPVEESGGLGTQCGHWDDATFGNELMTGFLDGGMVNPLSQLTVRSLRDIGLTVDVSAADPYTLPSGAFLRTQGGFDIAAAEILVPARGTIDPATGEIVIFPDR